MYADMLNSRYVKYVKWTIPYSISTLTVTIIKDRNFAKYQAYL